MSASLDRLITVNSDLTHVANWFAINRLSLKQVAFKVSRNVGILQKLRYIIPQYCLIMLYNCLILPYLQYCCIVWGCIGMTTLNPLILLQKSVSE